MLTIRRFVDRRVYTRRVRRGARLSTSETQRVLGVSLRMLRYMVARGDLRPRKVRGRLRFLFGDVLRLRRDMRAKA